MINKPSLDSGKLNLPSFEHPWQQGPTELIAYGLQHIGSDKEDFDRRVAFLFLDLGVETLFKTFLELPEEVTGATVPFHKRSEASRGSFHDLIRGLRQAAGDRVEERDMYNVVHFHGIRNRLYHEGAGTTVVQEQLLAYAKLAVKLLRDLLNVNLPYTDPKVHEGLASLEALSQLQSHYGRERQLIIIQSQVEEAADELKKIAFRAYDSILKEWSPDFSWNAILERLDTYYFGEGAFLNYLAFEEVSLDNRVHFDAMYALNCACCIDELVSKLDSENLIRQRLVSLPWVAKMEIIQTCFSSEDPAHSPETEDILEPCWGILDLLELRPPGLPLRFLLLNAAHYPYDYIIFPDYDGTVESEVTSLESHDTQDVITYGHALIREIESAAQDLSAFLKDQEQVDKQ